MIPRVPPEVTNISALPGARNTTRVSSEPIEAVAGAVGAIGGLAAKHYEKKVEENNAAMLMGARREFDEWENAQFDPENGAMKGYVGANALNGPKDMVPAARKRVEEIGGNLPASIRQRWNEIAMNAETQFGDRVRRTTYQAHEAYQKFERESAESAMTNSAAIAVGTGDAATYEPKIAEAMALTEGQLKLAFGENANVTEALRKRRSAIYSSGITQALARNDLTTAEALLERHKDTMDAGDIIKATDALQPFRTEREADVEYGRYISGAATPVADAVIAAGQRGLYDFVGGIVGPLGGRITSKIGGGRVNGKGGSHNAGSLHYGKDGAVDVGMGRESPAQQERILAALKSNPNLIVRDERVRPPGQKVWDGPHLHIERRNGGAAPATAAQQVADIRSRYADKPAMRDALIRRVQQADQVRRAGEADLVDSVVERLAASDPWADPATIIPASERRALEAAGRWGSIVSHQKGRQGDQVWQDDDATLGGIGNAMEKDPKKWADNFDPTKYRHTLTQATISGLATQARNIRKGKEKSENFNYATESELLNAHVYGQLGITGDTANAKQAREVFAGQWLKTKQSWARRNPGKKMTAEDMNTEILRLRASFAMHGVKGVYESGKGKAKTTTNVDYAKAFGSEVPAAARKQIEAAYFELGRFPTEEQVRNAYLSGGFE